MKSIAIVIKLRNKIANLLDSLSDLVIKMPLFAHLFLVFLTLFVFLFPGFTSLPPLDRDEARFAQASRQMAEDQNYIVIKFQEELRAKKPIGIYWLQSSAASLFGKNKISSYRVPNLLAGIAICILMGFFTFSILYNFASQSWSNSFTLSLLSVLFIAVNSGFAIEVRQAKTDTVLLLLCFIQQWIIWKIYSYGKLEWNIFKTNKLSWIVRFFWVIMAFGVLIKGPIAPILAILTVAGILVLDRFSEKKWSFSWLSLFLWTQGLAIFLIIIIPWVYLAWNATEGALILNALNEDLLGKIKSGKENHGAPPGSHFIILFFTFWPISLLLPIAGRACIDWSHQHLIRFLIAWILPFWLLMEIIPTKLPHYILPVFPALITLVIIGFSSPRSGIKLFRTIGKLYQTIVVLVSFLLFVAALYLTIVLSTNLTSIFWGFLCGILAIFSIIMGLVFLSNICRYKLTPLFMMTLFAGLSHSIMLGFVVPKLDMIHLSPRIASEIGKLSPYPEIIVSAGYHEPSLVFLLGRDTLLISAEEAALVLAEGSNSLAIVEKDGLSEFHSKLNILGKKVSELSKVTGYNLAKGESTSIGLYRILE